MTESKNTPKILSKEERKAKRAQWNKVWEDGKANGEESYITRAKARKVLTEYFN